MVDDFLVVDGDVGLGGGQRLVPEELGGDVDGQPGGDGFGGEHAPEVVRGEAHRLPVGGGQPAGGERAVEEELDAVFGDGVGR